VENGTIKVVAALIRDQEGRVLLVRKRRIQSLNLIARDERSTAT
jgi:hypothetical protein